MSQSWDNVASMHDQYILTKHGDIVSCTKSILPVQESINTDKEQTSPLASLKARWLGPVPA